MCCNDIVRTQHSYDWDDNRIYSVANKFICDILYLTHQNHEHRYVHACMHVCISVLSCDVYGCVCVYVCVFVCVCVHVFLCLCMCVCVCVCVCVCDIESK